MMAGLSFDDKPAISLPSGMEKAPGKGAL